MRLTFLLGCGQLCPSSNQITAFFDTQYLWKESINIDFFHGDNLQGKLASEITNIR